MESEVRLERIKAIVTIVVTAIVNIVNVYGYAVDAGVAVNVALSVLAGISIIECWWRNQNITRNAVKAQMFLRGLRGDGDEGAEQDSQ